MSILRLQGVRRELGSVAILDGVDVALAAGERVGLVGPNGAGKTTLLRLCAGLDEPDAGRVERRRGLRVGFLPQEAHLDPDFLAAPDLRTAVRHGAPELEALEARLAAAEAEGRTAEAEYAELRHEFEIRGGYELDLRVEATLSGLGFERSDWSRPPTTLSGGEQTRALLARLVVADPDLLLLDEPTNHLDVDALEWLEEHLRRRSGATVVASHDRAFLDAVATRIWELRERRLTVFRGDYSAYARQRAERDLRAEREAEAHAARIARETELVARYRSQRKHTKLQEHAARLERLLAARPDRPSRGRPLRLGHLADVAGGGRSASVVLRADDLVVGYLVREPTVPVSAGAGRSAGGAVGGVASHAAAAAEDAAAADRAGSGTTAVGAPRAVVVARARRPLVVRAGERIGIVGPNGAGKTTLLRTIAGELAPLAGSLVLGAGATIGYLAQIRPPVVAGATVLDTLLAAYPVGPAEARSYLARFLFRGDDVFKAVADLSGGERSRLELALLGVRPANLLLLDEPTNHLDVGAREAIEAFLRESTATILLVSHDRRLLERVCHRLWVVEGGGVVPFEGDFRAWRAAVAAGWRARDAAVAGSPSVPTGSGAAGRPDLPAAAAVGGRDRRRSSSGRPSEPTPGRPSEPSSGPTPEPIHGPTPEPVLGPTPAPSSGRTHPAVRPAASPAARLSKDAYRRRRAELDAALERLGARRAALLDALADPAVRSNFVELGRVTSELAAVEAELARAEDAWLALEVSAP
jgi:ATP-binding cassette subfamily F protein 3